VRGEGLFIGIEMVKDRDGKAPDRERAVDVVNRLKDKGFLTSNAGIFGNVVKIRPRSCSSRTTPTNFSRAFDATLAEIDG
jgi:4-aminobutyrate aminotransferase-like enzyme